MATSNRKGPAPYGPRHATRQQPGFSSALPVGWGWLARHIPLGLFSGCHVAIAKTNSNAFVVCVFGLARTATPAPLGCASKNRYGHPGSLPILSWRRGGRLRLKNGLLLIMTFMLASQSTMAQALKRICTARPHSAREAAGPHGPSGCTGRACVATSQAGRH